MSHDPHPATGGVAGAVTAEAILVQIGDILDELLGRRIDPEENYFEAGLDSLTVEKFRRLVATRLNRYVPPMALFERPNLYGTAALLANARPPGESSGESSVESSVGRTTSGRDRRAGGSRREIRASIRRDENWRLGGQEQDGR